MLDVFLEFVQDENHSILLSSHITSDLEKIADYITFIHNGKLIMAASKNDLVYYKSDYMVNCWNNFCRSSHGVIMALTWLSIWPKY